MGWAPGEGDDWRKDYSRAQQRAKRLRADEMPAERKLWKLLRMLKHDGAHFRRQCHVGHFVYDFACLSHKLLIELDGGVHDWPDVQLRDEAKTESARQRGFRLLRVRNEHLADEQRLIRWVRANLSPPTPNPSPKGEGK